MFMDANKYLELKSRNDIYDYDLFEKNAGKLTKEFFNIYKNELISTNLKDFKGKNINILYKNNIGNLINRLIPGSSTLNFNDQTDEILFTLKFSDINVDRNSVRLCATEKSIEAIDENDKKKIYSIINGLKFIESNENEITPTSLRELYEIAVNNIIDKSEALSQYKRYRDGSSYQNMMKHIDKTGAYYLNIAKYVEQLIEFINNDEDNFDPITKSCIIHWYFCFIRPYYNGNERMGRLVQYWYLHKKGYSLNLFYPLTKFQYEQREEYIKVFKNIENSYDNTGYYDITPFINFYFNIITNFLGYKKGNKENYFSGYFNDGLITAKEREIYNYLLENYNGLEFSTKQIEKEMNISYETIRRFTIHFLDLGLIEKINYTNRPKFKLIT